MSQNGHKRAFFDLHIEILEHLHIDRFFCTGILIGQIFYNNCLSGKFWIMFFCIYDTNLQKISLNFMFKSNGGIFYDNY
jgi:hypothetical protein